jgi:hypothetical protein
MKPIRYAASPNGPQAGLTRRSLLRTGGLAIAGLSISSALPPAAWGQSAATFDYYIGPTGTDGNPGTLGSPWAITAINTKRATYAGKRLGILPGTYDVSSLMNSSAHTPVLNINGGTGPSNVTYIGTSNATGQYQRGTATITANGNGLYGGGNGNVSSIIGQGGSVANWGYWTIDGLTLTGFSLWAVHVGNYDGSNGTITNATIQNCEFTGGSAQNSTVASGVNLAPLVIYKAINTLVTNNYFHDNYGWTDSSHFSAIYQWGLAGGPTAGSAITYNTFVNTGNVHGKEATMYDTTVAYNYIDMTNKTPSGGYTQGIFGFGQGSGKLSSFHHNIIISDCYIDLTNDTGSNAWTYPCAIYNNTFAQCRSSSNVGVRWWEAASGTRLLSFYNNLFYDNGYSGIGYLGYVCTNTDAFSVCDYNIYGGHDNFTSVAPGVSADSSFNAYKSLAAWQTAIGSLDAHSSSKAINPFTNTGPLALQYGVTTGSIAYNSGKVGGISTGATCSVGAWDGTVAQIGHNFGARAVPPNPLIAS